LFNLAVCEVNQWQHIAGAAVIIVLAVLVGMVVALRGGRLGGAASVVATLLLSGILPLALIKGFWPFHDENPFCGFTPDPNVWVIYATLLSLLWSVLALIGLRLLRRG
jgi:ABC-type branched-subunit amino acid transport system permease subunit